MDNFIYSFTGFSTPAVKRFSASAQLMIFQIPWTYPALLLRYYITLISLYPEESEEGQSHL